MILTPMERHRRLLAAARAYVHGEMTIEAYDEAKRRYLPDDAAAAAEIAEATMVRKHPRPAHDLPRDAGRWQRLIAWFSRATDGLW